MTQGPALNYAEVGGTVGVLPHGYRHLRRTRVIGRGEAAFQDAREHLFGWSLQRSAGFTVSASETPLAAGTVVRLALGPGALPPRLRPTFGCRVVYVVDRPGQCGFAYGTLEGHPEAGEEYFGLTLHDDSRVELSIIAFSRSATWWSRLGSPAARWAQQLITERYLHALG